VGLSDTSGPPADADVDVRTHDNPAYKERRRGARSDDSPTLREDAPMKVSIILVNDSILSGLPAAFQTSRAAGGAVVYDGSFPSWVRMNCCKATFWVHTVHTWPWDSEDQLRGGYPSGHV
jgi:hypothetical protein